MTTGWPTGSTTDRRTFFDAFAKGQKEYAGMMKRCADFDRQLMQETAAAGGQKYAELCALAYRQAISAHKLVTDKEGNLLFLSKENFSNGSIGTVDITYPSAPMFLCYNPELLKGMMNPIFYYSESADGTSLSPHTMSARIRRLTDRPTAAICRSKNPAIC